MILLLLLGLAAADVDGDGIDDLLVAIDADTVAVYRGNVDAIWPHTPGARARRVDGTFSAMVTGPVHKGIINDAGIPFTGHTEYLAQATGTEHVVMMLASDTLRVALLTTHVPLSEASSLVTRERLLVFVEVKLRSGRRTGPAAMAVDRRKRRELLVATGPFLTRLRHLGWKVRYDVVAIDRTGAHRLTVRHYPGAFAPPSSFAG